MCNFLLLPLAQLEYLGHILCTSLPRPHPSPQRLYTNLNLGGLHQLKESLERTCHFLPLLLVQLEYLGHILCKYLSHPHPSPQRLYTNLNLGDLHQLRESLERVHHFLASPLIQMEYLGHILCKSLSHPTPYPKGYTPTSTWEVCINLRKV